MDMLAYRPLEFNFLQTLAQTFFIVARQNQFIQENIFNNAPVCRIALALNKNSAFTGSFTEKACWYQQFDLRQIRILRGGQPLVDFYAADNCHLYVTTMKTMTSQDDIPSISNDSFKDHYVLVFDVTSMQDDTGNRHYPELVGEPLRLELNFTYPLEHVTELSVLGKQISSVAVEKFGVVGKKSKLDNASLQHLIYRLQLLKHWFFGSIISDHVTILPNDTFAIKKTQPSKMQGEQWILIANSRRKLCFAYTLGRPCFPKQ